MALPKHFISHRLEDLEISKSEFAIGVTLGVFTTLIFYALCNVFIDVFRFLVIDEENDSWFLSKDQRFFFNLFYAYFSAILGQAISMNYLLYKSKRVFIRKRFRLMDIRANLNFTIWNTMHWFGQAALGYGVFYFYFFYELELYPQYNYFFILLLIALFITSWNPFLQIFKRQAYKIIISSAVFISILAFALSQVNITDRFNIEDEFEKYSIHYHFKYDKIESEYYQYTRQDLTENLYIVFPKDSSRKNPVIVSKNKEIELDRIQEFVRNARKARDETDRKFLSFNLCVDKDIPMSFVNQVKLELAIVAQYKIGYAVVPSSPKHTHTIYSSCYIPIKSPPLSLAKFHPPPPKTPYFLLDRSDPEFELLIIRHESDTVYDINGEKISQSEYQEFFAANLGREKKKIFVYLVDGDIDYEFYLKTIINGFVASEKVKNNYALKKYNLSFDELKEDKRKIINRKFPIPVIEVYPKLLKEVVKMGDLEQEDFDFYFPDYHP